jgi:hypothetical protein
VTAYCSFSIPGPMPSTNDILDARMRVSRSVGKKGQKHNAYSEMKKRWTEKVGLLARAAQIVGDPEGQAMVLLTVYEPNQKRDHDNVAGGAQKLVRDGLVKAGVLRNDGWKDLVAVVLTEVKLDRENPRVAVEVHWGAHLRIQIGEEDA